MDMLYLRSVRQGLAAHERLSLWKSRVSQGWNLLLKNREAEDAEPEGRQEKESGPWRQEGTRPRSWQLCLQRQEHPWSTVPLAQQLLDK